MERLMAFSRVMTFLICALLLLPLLLRADTYLNGSVESSFDVNKNGLYQWKLDYPWTRYEARFFSGTKNADLYAKTIANIDYTLSPSDQKYLYKTFAMAESAFHGGLALPEKGHADFYIFYKQNRFFLGDPLFSLVNADKDKWDYDSLTDTSYVAGSVFESSGLLPGLWVKAFGAAMYRSSIQAYGVRLYDSIIKDALSVGATVTYKNWSAEQDAYNLVTAGDLWFNLAKTYITAEAAVSKNPSEKLIGQDNLSWKGEIRRDLNFARLGLPIGKLGFLASYRDVSKDFRAYLSKDYDDSRKYDQQGYYGEVRYFVPDRAVTFTYRRDQYKKHSVPYSETWNYGEMYVEFINNFNFLARVSSSRYLDTDKVAITLADGTPASVYQQDDTWTHAFVQLEMQNEISYVKLQSMLMNISTPYQKWVYGAEFSFNITEKLKSLNRMLIVDESFRTRSTFWSQLQYRYGEGTDLYFEYGNSSYVDNDLVNDGDFVSSDRLMEQKFHLYVKAGF